MQYPKSKPCPLVSEPILSSRELVDLNIDRVRVMAMIVHKRRSRCGSLIERGDLIAWGAEGLIDAANRFDSHRGISFATFAVPRIRGAMLDGLRQARIVAERECELGDLEPLVSEHREPGASVTLARAIKRLPERQRSILRAHYLEGTSLRGVGRRLGISRARALREHDQALADLRKELAA